MFGTSSSSERTSSANWGAACRGHSLRVSIGGGDFPHSMPPLPQLANELQGGVVEILHDKAHQSALTLPTIGDSCVVPVPADAKPHATKKKKPKRKKARKRRGKRVKPRAVKALPAKPAPLVVDGCRALPIPSLIRG